MRLERVNMSRSPNYIIDFIVSPVLRTGRPGSFRGRGMSLGNVGRIRTVPVEGSYTPRSSARRARSLVRVALACARGRAASFGGAVRMGFPHHQSDCAITPPCSVWELQLARMAAIAGKSLQDFWDCCQWSSIPAGDS